MGACRERRKQLNVEVREYGFVGLLEDHVLLDAIAGHVDVQVNPLPQPTTIQSSKANRLGPNFPGELNGFNNVR